jgi:hypothetical protein
MILPTVGEDTPQVDFSCLDKYAGFFRGEAPRNLPHIGQAAVDARQLWKQRNYHEFRRSLEAQFVNVDLDTANQRYRELVRRHDSVERSRINRFISSDSKCVGKEMGCKRNLLFDALLRRDPYVGDFMEDILNLTFVNGMTSEFAWTSVINEEIVRDYLKCVMSIIRQLRPEIVNVALDEPMVGEIPVGGKYKKRVRTLRRNKRNKRRRRSLKRKRKRKI